MIDKKLLLQIITQLEKEKYIFIYSDDKWDYPTHLPIHLRDQINCKMLTVMFNLEKKKGIIIHIPNMTLEELKQE